MRAPPSAAVARLSVAGSAWHDDANMKLSLSQADLASVDVDLLIVPIASSDYAKDATFKQLDATLGGELGRIAKLEEFTGKKGQSFTLHTFAKLKARKLRLVSVFGKDKGPGVDEYRALGTNVARSVREYKSFAVYGPAETELVSALAEGLLLGDYRYAEYLTGPRKPKPAVARGLLITRSKPDAALRAALNTASIIAEAVNITRDLVNAPPNEMNPAALAEEAKRVARASGVRCTVWGRAEIVRRGMTLLAAVNAGSDHEARFIHMSYVPRATRKKVAKVVFVGKGLTFDSGGLSIKPAKSMETMKCDMAGGAATIAIVMAAARLKLPVEVHGIIPSTDNVINGNAMRPGDIYRTLDGKTVEVLNTDAEGRLILADALTYARDLKPTVMVDHATLTGAVMVALGQWRAGLYATDDALRDRYLDAAKRSGEAFWPLPLDEDIRETIKSPIADIKNTGDGYGGSIAAALFLREFVGDSPWIHLDIAGPAYLSSPHGILPKGGTGFGVRTALEFIKSFAE
ncbi:MAG: cytosol aminopeptidase [Myxococcaceae bacterium]|nr:cytosol aminopeptidase [Myxococcaceae bacterium]